MKKSVKKEKVEDACNCSVFCRWHSSSLNVFLHLVAFVILVGSLWNHSWTGVLVAVIVAAFGHFVNNLRGKK